MGEWSGGGNGGGDGVGGDGGVEALVVIEVVRELVDVGVGGDGDGRGGDGVGGDDSVDGEAVDRHLLDLLLWKVEVLDGEVGEIARGLRVGPGSLDQDVSRRRRLLQGFEDGDGLPV